MTIGLSFLPVPQSIWPSSPAVPLAVARLQQQVAERVLQLAAEAEMLPEVATLEQVIPEQGTGRRD